jgi:hypothetical protein
VHQRGHNERHGSAEHQRGCEGDDGDGIKQHHEQTDLAVSSVANSNSSVRSRFQRFHDQIATPSMGWFGATHKPVSFAAMAAAGNELATK